MWRTFSPSSTSRRGRRSPPGPSPSRRAQVWKAVPMPESRRAAQSETTLLYLVKRVELAVRSRLDEVLRPGGLTTLQYTALTVLQRHPASLTSAQLARNSFVTAQTMAD